MTNDDLALRLHLSLLSDLSPRDLLWKLFNPISLSSMRKFVSKTKDYCSSRADVLIILSQLPGHRALVFIPLTISLLFHTSLECSTLATYSSTLVLHLNSTLYLRCLMSSNFPRIAPFNSATVDSASGGLCASVTVVRS